MYLAAGTSQQVPCSRGLAGTSPINLSSKELRLAGFVVTKCLTSASGRVDVIGSGLPPGPVWARWVWVRLVGDGRWEGWANVGFFLALLSPFRRHDSWAGASQAPRQYLILAHRRIMWPQGV